MENIKYVLDKHFAYMEEVKGNIWIEEQIPPIMINKNKQSPYKDILFWTPIESMITDKEIEELEDYFGHKLPNSYKSFLKYKHFVELQLGGDDIRFFKNLPQTIVKDTKEIIENYYWNLVPRNYLPFAGLSDYGVLCFDANQNIFSQDYPIISFDHEDGYQLCEVYSHNFESMFEKFNLDLDNWMNRYKT